MYSYITCLYDDGGLLIPFHKPLGVVKHKTNHTKLLLDHGCFCKLELLAILKPSLFDNPFIVVVRVELEKLDPLCQAYEVPQFHMLPGSLPCSGPCEPTWICNFQSCRYIATDQRTGEPWCPCQHLATDWTSPSTDLVHNVGCLIVITPPKFFIFIFYFRGVNLPIIIFGNL